MRMIGFLRSPDAIRSKEVNHPSLVLPSVACGFSLFAYFPPSDFLWARPRDTGDEKRAVVG